LGPLVFGYAYAWFNAAGHVQIPGAPFLLAALLHAAALALALGVMAHFKKSAADAAA
jgi:hypothetical protein